MTQLEFNTQQNSPAVKNIAARMNEQGLTVQQLATTMWMTTEQIKKLISGTGIVNSNTAYRLSLVLGLTHKL